MIIATNELRKLSIFFFALALSVAIGCDALTEERTASVECAMRAMSPNTNTNQ